MKRAFLLLLTPFLIASFSNAWWVDYIFEPKAEPTGTIKASEYHQEFSTIEIFTCENDKYFTNDQCVGIAGNSGVFSISGDFNNDGVAEQWSVGIAKYKSGKYPFATIAVLSNPGSGEIIQVLTVERKKPGFAVFFEYKDELILSFCMECENYVNIRWKNNSWVLVWPEPYG